MAFPTGWPPGPPSSLATLRAYIEGTTTDAFSDNAFLFIDLPGANPFQATPVVKAGDRTAVTSVHGPGGAGPATANESFPTVGGPKPSLWSTGIVIYNRGSHDILISFDGVNVHGRVPSGGEPLEMYARHEAGIALKSAGMGLASDFSVMAW